MADGGNISGRKADHLDLCATGDVGFRAKSTLFEQVELVHDALPELSLDEIDTSVDILGKKLRFPLFISAMTGGTPRAREINRSLAALADGRGYGFGLGSQRALLKADARGDKDDSYDVRDVAPNVLLLGNLGGVQAKDMAVEDVHALAKRVGADALCIHLNPAMEIVQPGGDRDFRGVLSGIETLARQLPIPIVVKETGCGIGPGTASTLARAGVKHVDVSGAGGTSWVAVETLRATGDDRALGEMLREWGVPTAASIAAARHTRPRFRTIIATGGVKNGVDAAKALALGAHAAGIARPVLQAFVEGGSDGAARFLDRVEAELRAVMLLVGADSIRQLRKAPMITKGELTRWINMAKRT